MTLKIIKVYKFWRKFVVAIVHVKIHQLHKVITRMTILNPLNSAVKYS